MGRQGGERSSSSSVRLRRRRRRRGHRRRRQTTPSSLLPSRRPDRPHRRRGRPRRPRHRRRRGPSPLYHQGKGRVEVVGQEREGGSEVPGRGGDGGRRRRGGGGGGSRGGAGEGRRRQDDSPADPHGRARADRGRGSRGAGRGGRGRREQQLQRDGSRQLPRALSRGRGEPRARHREPRGGRAGGVRDLPRQRRASPRYQGPAGLLQALEAGGGVPAEGEGGGAGWDLAR
jgi:hypothetical protein